jgi:hypothetical protein
MEVIAKVKKDEVTAILFEETSRIGIGPSDEGWSFQSPEFHETPNLIGDYYFPLGDSPQDSNRIINPINHTNIVYDGDGAWVGTAVENKWPNQTWTGTSTSGLSSYIMGSTKHKLSGNQTTLHANNKFSSAKDYYTVSAYYKQNSGPYTSPTKFVLTSNTSGTEITRTSNDSNITSTQEVYVRGWHSAYYEAAATNAYPYIINNGDSSFLGMQVEQNYFVSPWCASSRGQGELTYNLYSLGLNWNQDYTIMYWKKPHGNDARNPNSGYSAESFGSSALGKHLWLGRNESTRKYEINGTTGNTVDSYRYDWFLHVLRRSGTNFNMQVFRHSNKNPVVDMNTTAVANTANYYVTPQGYDFRLGGRDAGYASNAYYRDLQVLKKALTDEEVKTYFNTKFKVLEDHIAVGLMTEGAI